MALGRREGKDDAGCPDSTAEDSPWMMALDTHRTLRHVPGHGSSLLQEEAGQSFLYTIIYNTFFYVFMAHPYVDGSLVVPFPLFRLAFRIAVRHFYHLEH